MLALERFATGRKVFVVVTAVLTWGGSMAALAVAGIATSVWRLSGLWGQAGVAFLSGFGLIAIVGTVLLVGGPVFLWAR